MRGNRAYPLGESQEREERGVDAQGQPHIEPASGRQGHAGTGAPGGQEALPDGYVVVQTDGHYVGAWRARELAEKVCNRSPSIKGERVVPFRLLEA